MLKPRNSSVFLPRPISVARWELPGRLGFVLAHRGPGVAELAALRPGESVLLTGPLGRGWQVAAGSLGPGLASGGGKVALVAGGVGFAPLYALVAELFSRDAVGSAGPVVHFYAGFQSLAGAAPALGAFLSPLKDWCEAVQFATEDGSHPLDPLAWPFAPCRKGRVTELFEPGDYDAVCTCGPEGMMRAVAMACEAAGTACLVSLERRMACGVGACLGCTVATLEGNRCCCTEGPVFPSAVLLSSTEAARG
jgi:dihydroorotate dehydrogenase electron transfer subunit